ncbi:MAG: hypothetical protein TEF_10675 [Rhizobiales bacterium NRL2]|jgi:hypothetical protein|nr:MAG: hypothetical protein TEF_10675 [Rhizobiales bacterium NRL2]
MNRNRNLLTTTCIAAMLAMPLAVQAGDDKAADQATAEQSDMTKTEDGLADARSDVLSAWKEFEAYTGEKLEPAVSAGEDLLRAMDRRIDLWSESDEPMKEQRVAEMRSIRADIADRLDEAKVEHNDGWSANAWSDFKESMGAAVDEFQALFDDTAYEDGDAPYEDATATGGD